MTTRPVSNEPRAQQEPDAPGPGPLPLGAVVVGRDERGRLLPGSVLSVPKRKYPGLYDRGRTGRLLAGSAPESERPATGGGQRGNLNAVRRPWLAFWKRRALRPEDRWVLTLVEDYVPSLVADKGGADAVSCAQMKVMELAAVARVCWALAMVAGDLRNVARFVNIERACLTDLGLERRARPVPSLSEILEARPEPESAT